MLSTSITLKKFLPLLTTLLCSVTFAKNPEHHNREFKKVKVKTTEKDLIDLNKRKEPVVIINFWASWCNPCIAEFKSLNSLIEKLGKEKIFVLGVNNDSDEALKKIKMIEKKYDLKFSSVQEEKLGLADKFHVSKIPTSIIFINKKFYKFIPEKFDFMNENFLKEISSKVRDINSVPKSK